MTRLVVDRITQPRSVWNKGNGHVLTTDYESITVSLDKDVSAEAGTIVFADPGTLNSGDIVEINIGFDNLHTAKASAHCCECEITGCIHIEMPNPLPADVAAYIADYFRRYSMWIANVSGTYNGTDTVEYQVFRAGHAVLVESNVPGLLTQTVTTAASVGGQLPNIGDGSALFTKVDRNQMTIPKAGYSNLQFPGAIRPLKAATGYATLNPVPCFFGVSRAKDRWVDKCDIDCCVPLNDCPEAVRKGTIQIPLEVQAPETYPECPVIAARYAADGAITATGGFRILGAGDALPAGMVMVTRGEIMMVHPNRLSAVMKLQ